MAKKLFKYSVVDAFTESPFKGNPAAVFFLEEDRDDHWLQSVAAEFNAPLTCYLSRITESEAHDSPNESSVFPRFRLRWFIIHTEVDLCGHATLAAAHTLFTSGKLHSDVVEFVTPSGILTAKRVPENNNKSITNENGESQEGFLIELNFPADPNTEFNSAEETLISKALFYEDYFCGSAHCGLAPFWCKELGKCDLVAYEASRRGGVLSIHVDEENQRVLL